MEKINSNKRKIMLIIGAVIIVISVIATVIMWNSDVKKQKNSVEISYDRLVKEYNRKGNQIFTDYNNIPQSYGASYKFTERQILDKWRYKSKNADTNQTIGEFYEDIKGDVIDEMAKDYFKNEMLPDIKNWLVLIIGSAVGIIVMVLGIVLSARKNKAV